MSLVAEDRQKVIAAVNQGIDAYLEACFVPGRGDSFRVQTPPGIRGESPALAWSVRCRRSPCPS